MVHEAIGSKEQSVKRESVSVEETVSDQSCEIR